MNSKNIRTFAKPQNKQKMAFLLILKSFPPLQEPKVGEAKGLGVVEKPRNCESPKYKTQQHLLHK
jgi:hypothetical protein